jgi:hypothetical protein
MLAAPGDLPWNEGKLSKYMQPGEGKQVTGLEVVGLFDFHRASKFSGERHENHTNGQKAHH